MVKNKADKQKGSQHKPSDSQLSILSFLTPAFASVGTTPEAVDTVNGSSTETGKKLSLEKGNDRVSPDE